MFSHHVSIIASVMFLFICEFSSAYGQTIVDQKAGVVKITATIDQQRRIGTGFIVSIENDTAYIVTASHVVEGAALTVLFFPNPDKDYGGTTRNMQAANPKGLAVIKVQGPLPKGIRPLSLASTFDVKGGEKATVIGFRRSPPIQWGVLQGILTGQIGADLIVSGAVANEGNSGGPILVEEKVVGVLTEVLDDIGYAVPASITQIILKGWGLSVEQDSAQVERKDETAQTKPTESLPPGEPILNINGIWRDSNYPSNVSQITQDGNRFKFQRRGVLPNRTQFESTGTGTITGRRFTSHYTATYQWGATSVGDCSGTVSSDGMRMEMNCGDTLLGTFLVTAIRQ